MRTKDVLLIRTPDTHAFCSRLMRGLFSKSRNSCFLKKLVDEAGYDRDSGQEDAGNVRDDDRPLARLRADAVDRPETAVEECCQRLPEHAGITREVRGDLRNVRDVHDDREHRCDIADDGDDPLLIAPVGMLLRLYLLLLLALREMLLAYHRHHSYPLCVAHC